MPGLNIPPGWTRKKTGKKIVYVTDLPKCQIWSKNDFDKFKKGGRFLNIDRDTLNFSIKVGVEVHEEAKVNSSIEFGSSNRGSSTSGVCTTTEVGRSGIDIWART